MINIKDGGLAIYGGILGGAITTYIFCKKRNLSFFDLADYIIPYLALRTEHWKMGEFYQCRSIWKCYESSMENRHSNECGITICPSNFFI